MTVAVLVRLHLIDGIIRYRFLPFTSRHTVVALGARVLTLPVAISNFNHGPWQFWLRMFID
jgi:hypothetical protein